MLNTELGFPKRLFQLNEHLQEVEEEAMAKTVELEKQLSEANTELEQLKVQQHGLLSTLSFPGALCTALSLPLSLSFCLSVSLCVCPPCLCVCVSLFFGQSVKCACMWFVLLDHEERGTLNV